ncbi:uncharacterized protein BXZ73DRAFT_73332 [Epithele typhae]|uniref:uncharacterized protein n=1 Tax=Epithele typhae TaxID=378194 RepID=UPI0020074BB2|nr:uncharacterized protein BXZ73DRAFT_73332 [Epithele typhae]KAH9945136.1 hypothetical protein BXZ73DRAFT_73332 [Epithele typhae]
MHEQCSAAVPAISLVMPHPALPRRRSSMLSTGSGPHTPPPRDAPLPSLFSPASNRKSSDSWNSSIYDGADDLEWEWKPEQTRLLSRTLDALPAHLLTPFNGPVPPSNLLDKIARGVSARKGPVEWPHSLRATRAKIVELARLRAKDDTASDTIAEEESTDPEGHPNTNDKGTKRPLYRQSSMDFMQSPKLDTAGDAISRLTYRLQHTERMILNPAHPFLRTSPHHRTIALSSTASSTTLNSQSSCGSESHLPRLRRSLSSISNTSDQPGMDPRVQRLRRTESFAGSALYPPGSPLKCAPSFGSLSRRNSDLMSVDCSNRSDVTTSDEEEKVRSKKAKKPKVKPSSPTPPLLSPLTSPVKTKQLRRTTKHISKGSVHAPAKDLTRQAPRTKLNVRQNPSILGPELPCVTAPTSHTSQPPSPIRSRPRKVPSTHTLSASNNTPPCQTPATSSPRTLRRVRGVPMGHKTVGRKISFGSLPTPEEENVAFAAGQGLGSAFQLR